MAEPNDVNVDELKRRARRRLVGAVVLALAAAVFVPMLLESDPKPLGEDVSVRIPPVDDGKFVNRLSDKGKIEPPRTPAKGEPPKAEGQKAEPPKPEAPRVDAAPASSAKDAAAAESAVRDSAAKEGTKEPASRESVAKDSAPKDAAPASPAKSTLGDAERKMLNATPKPAPANSAQTKTASTTAAPAATAPPAAPATPSPTPAAKAEGGPGFSVQLAAFADDKGANALSNKLKKSGYPAYTEPLTTSKGTLWRVRVGPFPSRDAAASSRDKLKGEGYSGIVAPAN